MANRGSSEALRVFQRAADLLSSSAPDSDQELLDMVRKAKKEQEQNIFHPPKKLRTARAVGDSDAAAAAAAVSTASKLGAGSRPLPPDQQPQASNQPPRPSGLVRLGSNAGVARGRVEKPKRKTGR